MPVTPTSTPPRRPARPLEDSPTTSPLSGYKRSPSVSEIIQKYDLKNRSNPSSPSTSTVERKQSVPTPTRTGIPSRIGSSVRSSPTSPRKENRSASVGGTGIAGSSRSGSLSSTRVEGQFRNGAIGLGAPVGSKVLETRRATDSRIRSTRPSPSSSTSSIPRPRPSPSSSSSSIPRPSVSTNSSSSCSVDRTLTSPKTTIKPFPTSSPSLPRSTSDTFYTRPSSRTTTPSSSAGPSRISSPQKSAVALSVTRPSPSPSPQKRPLPLRRRSSKEDLTKPKSRPPITTRNSSHKASASVSSQSTNPTPLASPDINSHRDSTMYFGEFGERENQPTPIALEEGAIAMVRGGANRSSRSNQGTIVGSPTLSVSSFGSPSNKERIRINIPKRTSSNPNSPKTPRSAGPHPISPRTTSIKLPSPSNDPPSPIAARHAQANFGIYLEPTASPNRISIERPGHRRGSSQSSVSRLSEAASTIKEPIKRPTSAATARPSFESKVFPSASSSPRISPPPSPKGSPSRLATRKPSSSPRKSPNLTIQTPPTLINSRLSTITSAQPSPPVPAKSPLRSLSRENADPNSTGRQQTPRSGSGESNIAQVGTPTSLRSQLEKMAELEESSTKLEPPLEFDSPVQETIPQNKVDSSASQVVSTPNEIRFTSFTVPSMYSQDSAPSSAIPSATSWNWSEDTARSSIDGTAKKRQSRLDSVEWGKQKDMPPPSSQRSSFDLGRENGHRRSFSLPRLSNASEKALPHIPDDVPSTAATHGSSDDAIPMSPTTITDYYREPAKSPSLPILREGKVSRHSYTPESPISNTQSPSLTPSAYSQNGKAAETPLRPLLPSSPSIVMSKRSHLIREIASSERAYAKDLALIRDAYMYRFFRPGSLHSTNGDSSISPSDGSRRSSVYTYQTNDTKRSSEHDSTNWIFPGNGSTTPLPKSPSDGYNLSYFSNSAAGSSNSSFQITPQPSLKHHKRSSSSIPSMGMQPPIGKPLSPADLKTVFLNLDQIASAADELATAFEQAMGEEETGVQGGLRENETGNDRLGQAFVAMIPRIRPLYNFYCARQSQASLRLMELQADAAHNAHLKECWLSIKNHTHAWNLDSMLIKPVQRITKYPLLFDDLLSSTTPVHPDYFSIRTAAQMSKTIALEIDETKRRKDVVSNAISSKRAPTTNVSPKETKQPASKLLGLGRFRKDKAASSTISLSKSVSSTDLALPATISDSSLNTLKDLVIKVEEIDKCVRRVGKEVILWTAAAKEVLVAEDGVVKTWLRVIQLEPTDAADRRMLEFRKVIDSIIAEVWKELNDQVRQHIMPIFTKLLESTSNPRKVIHKRDTKYTDYTRYHALRVSKKAIERSITQSALEFVALHTQLVDELPAFLEGCLRLLDIALIGFSRAQAQYHQKVKEHLLVYEEAWIVLPLSPKVEMRSPTDTSTSRGIVKAWHDGWSPYAEAMDHFTCTRPARTAATRIASFNAKPGSRPTSRSGSPMLSPGHGLRHSASVTSPTSLSGSRPSSPAQTGRFRSSSMRSQTGPSAITVTSPKDSQSSMFSLLRRSNSKTNGTSRVNERPTLYTRTSSGFGLKPSSASMISEASSRLSWGLPRISADPNQPIFDGLGLSPTKSTTGLVRSNSQKTSPQISTSPSITTAMNNIFSVDLNSSQVSLASTNTNTDTPPQRRVSANSSSAVGLGLGDVSTLTKQQQQQQQQAEPTSTNRHPFAAIPPSPRVRQRTDEVDAAEGWKNEQVIYQCACVADFDPMELGNRRYRGLKFIPMISGDLIDVFHEVGRIDELPSFPYPEVGVDNDGVLVARSENGSIGLVICSFLEPLRD